MAKVFAHISRTTSTAMGGRAIVVTPIVRAVRRTGDTVVVETTGRHGNFHLPADSPDGRRQAADVVVSITGNREDAAFLDLVDEPKGTPHIDDLLHAHDGHGMSSR